MAYITLNKKHFFNNLDIIATLTKTKDKIALVLKDNAYGHGLLEISSMAKEYGITKAVVQLESEAVKIKDLFEYILILADTPKDPQENFCYTINSLKAIKTFPADTRVELKVNTGMNRNGIEMAELQAAFEMIEMQGLQLEAVFTHHGCADEVHPLYEIQKHNFSIIKLNATTLAEQKGFAPLRFHSCNSAALFREDTCIEDMARVGIAAYGCLKTPFSSKEDMLQPVLALYAHKISSRYLPVEGYVGYGATFKAVQELMVSTYDIGYGDGFLRILSNNYTTPDGIKIAGRISMDNSSFLSKEDQVCIFNDAREIAPKAKTISYEILTSLKPHLQRKIVE